MATKTYKPETAWKNWNTSPWRWVLLGLGLMGVVTALAYWGGTAKPGPLFNLGVAAVALTLPALGLLIWWLLFSPLPATAAALQPRRLSVPVRQMLTLFAIFSGVLLGLGGLWDEIWHRNYGLGEVLDDFFWRPHQLIYASFGFVTLFGLFALITLLRQPAGPNIGLRARLRAEPLVTLLAVVAGYLLVAAPIDALWHQIYGLDLTGWSLPHVILALGIILIMFSALALQISLIPASPWRKLGQLHPREMVALLILMAALTPCMLIIFTDFEGAKLPGPGGPDAFVLAFWQRPPWLYPVALLALATLFGQLAIHSLRRVGVASLLGLLVVGLRVLGVAGFMYGDNTIQVAFVSQLFILVPLFALDAWYLLRFNQPEAPLTWMGGVVASLVALLLVSVPFLPMFLPYFQTDFGFILGALLVGVPVGLWFSWVGVWLGRSLAADPRVAAAEPQTVSARMAWASATVLAISFVFTVTFIITATPPG